MLMTPLSISALVLHTLIVQSPTVDQLTWLTGCWTMTRADSVVEEQWLRPLGGTLMGISRTVKAGRTIEHEFLQIRDVNGTLAYIANPSGQAEATFALKTFSEKELIFENPTHDFPQRIIYRRTADGVTARVEGTRNGQSRGVDFVYSRCR
jgi:uncharacterized protein DUF6265